MGRLKLMTVLGTRPEIIRLSSCIRAFDRHFRHVLVHTGQNWDDRLSRVFFEELEIRPPDRYLGCAGRHLGETLGNIIARSYEAMLEERPDALLVLGDTNSALSAISAKRLKIPIFHMEAGNRCWDWNVPEMINRKIVDHISDVNLPYTEHARRYLLSEGIDGRTVFVTGSPMPEVIADNREKIERSDAPGRLGLKKGEYFVVSAHREENIDSEKSFKELMGAINRVAERYGFPVVYSVHPRTMKAIRERGVEFHPLVRAAEPFGFADYARLQMDSACVLSDSGTLSEESAILRFPAVLLRTSTERPEALDGGTIIVGGIGGEDVEQAVELALEMRDGLKEAPLPSDYAEVKVSSKVVRIIQSYTKIVDTATWRKVTSPP